ncbi:MAG: ribose-phosphate pyrophosphokinase [Candidatus Dormibacteraeota bacterium]|nr:ribose-phosphate pyrophosphokinase [Candidatus Dormibacteraeota bacterium]
MIGRVQTAVEFASEDVSPWGELKVLSGTANPELAERIAAEIGIPVTDSGIRTFSDTEITAKIGDSMRGHDVFVVQPTSPPVNEHLMELFILLDALRRASAGRVTAVVPYYAYARKERKSQPREPISAKLIANFIQIAGADRLLLLDLHVDAIEGFFDVPTDHLTARKILAGHLVEQGLHRCAVVAPDAGGAKRAESMATLLGAPTVFVYKGRPRDEVSEVLEVAGDVEGRDCVVVDDMVTTGGTLIAVAEALKRRGARRVVAAVTHALLTGHSSERLEASGIDELVVTDSIPVPPEKLSPRLTVLSVAPLLAEAILRVHQNRSVSALFQ